MHSNGWHALESRAFVSRKEAIGNEYVQQFRMPTDVFIQSPASMRSVVAATDGGKLRACTQALRWSKSTVEGRLLDFHWQTESEHDLSDVAVTWYHQGAEIDLAEELGKGATPDELLRWSRAMFDRREGGTISGGLQLLIRQHRLVEAIGTKIFNPNQPLLLVPQEHHAPAWRPGQPLYCIAVPAIDHVLSGAGPIGSPLYMQLRAIIKEVSGMAPWQMFRRAGSCAAILFDDLVKAGKQFEQALKNTMTALFEDPFGMLGFGHERQQKAVLMLGSRIQSLKSMVPWWFHDHEQAGYSEPDPATCFVMARRVDSCRVVPGGSQNGINLGLPATYASVLRQAVDPAAGKDASDLAGGL